MDDGLKREYTDWFAYLESRIAQLGIDLKNSQIAPNNSPNDIWDGFTINGGSGNNMWTTVTAFYGDDDNYMSPPDGVDFIIPTEDEG